MSGSAPTNVMAAFEILVEEIEAEIELTNQLGARAFENGDLDRAQSILDRARQLSEHRERVVALRREWTTLVPDADGGDDDDDDVTQQRQNFGRLPRGMRTPEEDFYLPILRALKQLGGSAKTSDVLDTVGELMADTLREVDYEPLLSDPKLPRWRNTAAWARNHLVREGYLRDDSPKGTWELSDKGRQYVASEHK